VNILNRAFKYTPAAETDLRKSFARIRRRQREEAEAQAAADAEAKAKVAPIGARKTART
jgi:hypothetical protein